jgi:hypothetical protein
MTPNCLDAVHAAQSGIRDAPVQHFFSKQLRVASRSRELSKKQLITGEL